MKFKVGDRVKDNDGDKGTILCIYDDVAWVLMADKDGAFPYVQDINCLRKLKPKVKREPRRVWVNYFKKDDGEPSMQVYSAEKLALILGHGHEIETVEFVEVLK